MPYLTFSLTEGPLKARPRKGPARCAEDAVLALGKPNWDLGPECVR